jgi:hypothetical protein
MTGFTLSWTLAGQSSWTLSGNGRVPEETRATRSGIPAPAVEPSIPTKDVPGTDILGLPRYPGSVRIQYMRKI